MSTYNPKPQTSCRELPQHGLREALWPFDNLVDSKDDDGPITKTLSITICFIKGSGSANTWGNKRTAVLNSIKKDLADSHGRKTWEHFANIQFDEVEDPQKAKVRIGFDQRERQRSWSFIGQEADKHVPDVTLNLGDLDSEAVPSLEDFGTILHEFGHALGLAHEHQSPLRSDNATKLIEKYYGDTGQSIGSAQLLKDQIFDTLSGNQVTNLTRFDSKSIMMYYVKGLTDKPNTELSKLDQAFITLSYPPDLTDHGNAATKERLSRFMTAINDLGLKTKGGEILDAFLNPGPVLKMSLDKPEPCDRLQAVRKRFAESNDEMALLQSSVLSRSVIDTSTKGYSLWDPRSMRPSSVTDPALAQQYGLSDPLRDVARNKLFLSFVRCAVKNIMEQRGVPAKQAVPGASPNEVARTVGAICMHAEIARYVKAYRDDFQGGEPVVAGRAQDVVAS